ncbi:MAG: hypothetical protein DWQ36_13910 [Acidobacteria bacterium]|nr:MAG: hypothetical protein DWQ30_20045 [Acidobacteriota bacterium]REK06303.1 MAG: hypothetical protein DWQ36_13910 [Acidobacteriota bacterium]
MRQLAFVIIASLPLGVAAAQDEQRLVLVAKLVEFSENAEWSHAADGSFSTYHLSRFVVVVPSRVCGKELVVLHSSIPDSGTPWRQIGKSFEMALSDERAAALLEEQPSGPTRVFYGTTWTEILGEVESAEPDCGAEAP